METWDREQNHGGAWCSFQVCSQLNHYFFCFFSKPSVSLGKKKTGLHKVSQVSSEHTVYQGIQWRVTGRQIFKLHSAIRFNVYRNDDENRRRLLRFRWRTGADFEGNFILPQVIYCSIVCDCYQKVPRTFQHNNKVCIEPPLSVLVTEQVWWGGIKMRIKP